MATVNVAPLELAEAVAEMRFPPKTDRRLRRLMDENNEGKWSPLEREELESLVELSEMMGFLRAKAFQVLRKDVTASRG